MNEVILYLTDYIIKSLVAVILLLLLSGNSYNKKRKIFSISFIVICISCYLVFYSYNFGVFLFSVGILAFVFKIIENKRKIHIAIWGAITYMYIFLLEDLSYILCLLICKKYDLKINNYYDLLSYIVSLVLFVLIILHLNKKKIQYWEINFKNFSAIIFIEFLITFIIVSITNMIYQILFNMNYSFEYQQLIFGLVWLSFIFINTSFFAGCLFLYLKQLKKELSFNQTYFLMEKEYLNILKQHEEDIRKFQHDVNKHLSMLQLLLDTKEYKQVYAYLQELNSNYRKIKKVHKTGNEIMDLIVNEKVYNNPQITFKLKGSLPSQFSISQYDFCTVLLNILDNAIEANKKNKDKYINISMGYYNNYISLVISNPVEIKEISSYSKHDKQNRGYGIINIKETLSKYEHQFNISQDEQLFEVSILLRYK